MTSPIRVLHVLGALDTGGIENWLIQVLSRTNPSEFQMDFAVYDDREFDFSETARSGGARLYPLGRLNQPFRYVSAMRTLLKEQNYHIVHSHLNELSGFALFAAHQHGVPVRVAHSHTVRIPSSSPLLRRGINRVMRTLVARYATIRVGCSRPSGESVFGAGWSAEPHSDVIHCGIDMNRFTSSELAPRSSMREHLGIPENAILIGHVGRFVKEKNHIHLIRIFQELVNQEKSVWGLFVGGGPLESEIRKAASEFGIADRIVFAGVRKDVPSLLRAMDVLLFPSLQEGLPLTVVESQSAGLPVVASEAVPEEAVLSPSLVRRLSLDLPLQDWTRSVLDAVASKPDETAALAVLDSDFNIDRSTESLLSLYRQALDGYESH